MRPPAGTGSLAVQLAHLMAPEKVIGLASGRRNSSWFSTSARDAVVDSRASALPKR